MKKLLLLILLLLLFCPAGRCESLEGTLDSVWDSLPLRDWQTAYDQAFPAGEDFRTLVLRLARGEMSLDAEELPEHPPEYDLRGPGVRGAPLLK